MCSAVPRCELDNLCCIAQREYRHAHPLTYSHTHKHSQNAHISIKIMALTSIDDRHQMGDGQKDRQQCGHCELHRGADARHSLTPSGGVVLFAVPLGPSHPATKPSSLALGTMRTLRGRRDTPRNTHKHAQTHTNTHTMHTRADGR